MASNLSTMKFQKSSVVVVCGLTMFTLLVLLHLEGVIDVSWSVTFIPLWFVYIAIGMVVWSMYDSFVKRKLMTNAKTVGTLGCFVLAALVATQIMIQVDLSYSEECRNNIQNIDLDDNEALSRLCSVKAEVLDYLFDNSKSYWNPSELPSLNESRGEECGDRLISREELRADFLSKLGCEIVSVDPVSNKPVRLEIGNECNRPIPVWWVISPLFFLLFVTVFVIIRSGGPSVIMVDGLGAHVGLEEVRIDDPDTLNSEDFDPLEGRSDIEVTAEMSVVIEGGEDDPLFNTELEAEGEEDQSEIDDVVLGAQTHT